MIRLKREQYAVGEVEGDVSVTVGIYFDVPIEQDKFDALVTFAHWLAVLAKAGCGADHLCISKLVQETMDNKIPGRPFYVETRKAGRGVQVYQPYGMPQEPRIVLDVKPCDEHGYNCPDHPEHGPWGPPTFGRLPDHES